MAIQTVAVLALAVVLTVSAVADDEPTLTVLRQLDLPTAIARANDVRWLGDGEILVSVGGQGIYKWRLGEDEATLVATLAGTRLAAFGQYQDYSRLGSATDDGLSFAGRLHGVYLQDEDEIALLKQVEIVDDIDRRHGRTAALGLARDEDGGDGDSPWESFIVWLLDDEGAVRGLLPTRDDGQGLDFCAFAELGVLRFAADGSLVVIPGAEPGVFFYDAEGRLRESLDTATFLADGGCGLEREESMLYREPANESAWLAQRRVIDEVVADDRGNLFFFVRHVPEPPSLPALGEVGASTKAQTTIHRVTVVDGKSGAARKIDGQTAGAVVAALREQGILPDGDSGAIQGTIAGQATDEVIAALREQGLLPEDFSVGVQTLEDGPLADAVAAIANADPPVAATDPVPAAGRVCWDLVHAHIDDLESVTFAPCAVEAERLDARLSADARGGRAVIVLREGAGLYARDSRAFEARLAEPSG